MAYPQISSIAIWNKYQKTVTNDDNKHKIKIYTNIVGHISKDDNYWELSPQPKCYNIDRTTSKFNVLTSKIDNQIKYWKQKILQRIKMIKIKIISMVIHYDTF